MEISLTNREPTMVFPNLSTDDDNILDDVAGKL